MIITIKKFCEKSEISYSTFRTFLSSRVDIHNRLMSVTKMRNPNAKRVGLLLPAHQAILNEVFREIGANID